MRVCHAHSEREIARESSRHDLLEETGKSPCGVSLLGGSARGLVLVAPASRHPCVDRAQEPPPRARGPAGSAMAPSNVRAASGAAPGGVRAARPGSTARLARLVTLAFAAQAIGRDGCGGVGTQTGDRRIGAGGFVASARRPTPVVAHVCVCVCVFVCVRVCVCV